MNPFNDIEMHIGDADWDLVSGKAPTVSAADLVSGKAPTVPEYHPTTLSIPESSGNFVFSEIIEYGAESVKPELTVSDLIIARLVEKSFPRIIARQCLEDIKQDESFELTPDLWEKTEEKWVDT